MAHTLRDAIRAGAQSVAGHDGGGNSIANSIEQLAAGDPATNFSQGVGIAGVVISAVGIANFLVAALMLANLGRYKPRAWAGCAALFIINIGPFIYYWLGLQNYAQFLSDPSNVVVEFWTWIALIGTLAGATGMQMFRASLIAAFAADNEDRKMHLAVAPGITFVVALIAGGWAAVTAFIMWNLSNTVIYFGVTSIVFAIAVIGCIAYSIFYTGASNDPMMATPYYMNIPYFLFWAFLIITGILGPAISGFYTYAQISIGYLIVFYCYIVYSAVCFWVIDYSRSDDDMGTRSVELRETRNAKRNKRTGEYEHRQRHEPRGDLFGVHRR